MHQIISNLKSEMILSNYVPYYLHNDLGINIVYSLIGDNNLLVIGEVKAGERVALDVSVFQISYIEENSCPFKIEFRMCGFEPLPLIDPNHCGAIRKQTKRRTGLITAEVNNYEDIFDVIVIASTDDHSRLISIRTPYSIENRTQLPLIFLFESPDETGTPSFYFNFYLEIVEIGPVDSGKSMSIPLFQTFWHLRSVKPYFSSNSILVLYFCS